MMFDEPTTSEVIHALIKKKDRRELSFRERLTLKYHKEHGKDEEYIQRINEAYEIVAARENRQYQPLMPSGSSNRLRSRSPNNRRGYGRQQQSLPDISIIRRKNQYPNFQEHDRQRQSLPCNSQRNRYRSRSRSPTHRNVHDQLHPIQERNYPMQLHHSPSQFYRKERSPTPINDDHIVDATNEGDWNPDSLTPRNNNAVDTSSSSLVPNSNSQSEPFIMGTLQNVDNSCYMNAILYILRMTPIFVHNIHHLTQNIHCLSDSDAVGTVTASDCPKLIATSAMISNQEQWPSSIDINERQKELINELHRIFANMTSLEVLKSTDSLAKSLFQNAVREIEPIFAQRTQQDSHEFLLTVLNCIRECGASLIKLVTEHASMFDNIIDPASTLSFDFIENNFIGKEMTTTKCICCETKSQCVSEVMDFVVPLPATEDLSDNFIQKSCVTREYLSKIRCDVCLSFQESTQTKSYPQLPRILIFHLSRFDNSMNKKQMITPTPMELNCFCTLCLGKTKTDECVDHKYRLYGVVVHLGVTLRSGHYMAFTRKFKERPEHSESMCSSINCCQPKFEQTQTERNDEMANGLWYNCNDEVVSVLSGAELHAKINQKGTVNTPYILFYVRNDLLANH